MKNRLLSVLALVISVAVLAGPASAQTPAAEPPAAAEPAAEPKTPNVLWLEEIEAQPWNTGGNFWLPTPAAEEADPSDFMFYAVLGLSIFFFTGVTLATVYFVIKYRARPGHKAQPSPSHNDTLEITWTVIPTIICVFLFLGGWRGYLAFTAERGGALQIDVTGQKWAWSFTYPNGTVDNNLHVPVGQPVRLRMTSTDVLHSFYVPNFRVKQDLVPRRYTYLQFTPTRPGVYRLYCTEYCGKDHSMMKVRVIVHETGGYERYLATVEERSATLPPVELGKQLYEKKGCAACHSIDGSPRVGPSWKGIWGESAKMADGSTATVDAQYIKTAIEEPNAQKRAEFAGGQMTSYAGLLSEKEIAGLIAYIESLK